MDSFNSFELANCLWSFAKWAHRPPDTWLETYYATLQTKMLALQPAGLSSITWAAAMLSLRLPQQLMDSIMLEAQVGPGWVGQHHPRVTRACMLLPETTANWVMWRCCSSSFYLVVNYAVTSACLQVKFAAFSAHGFTTFAWSVCRLDIRPRRFWIEDFVRHTYAMLASFGNDQCFTNTIWALSNWEHIPPDSWLKEYCR